MPAQSPERKQARSPERMPALNLEKPVQSNKLDKLAQKEKLQSKHEKFQSRDLIENSVNRSEEKQSYTNKMQSNLEAYFNDQRLRQANKAQRNVRSMSKNVSSISIDESKKSSGAKKKESTTSH